MVMQLALHEALISNPRLSPAGGTRLFLAAKPALPMRRLDARLIVIFLSGHVVDALTAGVDVALDDAIAALGE